MDNHTPTDPYRQLDSDIHQCTRCAQQLAMRPSNPPYDSSPVTPRPIALPTMPSPILLIGQAPGIREYESGRPFQGGAGKEIRSVFAAAGVLPSKFDTIVYSTAIAKCYPGRKPTTRGFEDDAPSVEMVENCLPLLQRQIELIRPQIVVTLGRFPLRYYLQMRGRPTSNPALSDFVGRTEDWNGRTVISFPHTSRRSTWLNRKYPDNIRLFNIAKDHLATTIRDRSIVPLQEPSNRQRGAQLPR